MRRCMTSSSAVEPLWLAISTARLTSECERAGCRSSGTRCRR
jgi:hypothetical protein